MYFVKEGGQWRLLLGANFFPAADAIPPPPTKKEKASEVVMAGRG